MSETAIPSGLTVQQWDSKYYVEYLNNNWFKKFMGTGSGSMIQVREDLTKKPGDSITVALVNKLTGEASNHTDTLEGNEEDVTTRSHKITVREYSHAVRWPKFEEQKTGIDLRTAHKDVLMDWNMELDRDLIIRALGSINGVDYVDASEAQKDAWLVDNADRVLFGAATANNAANDHSAAIAQIDNTNDKLTPAAMSLMKRMAKAANPKIRPYKARTTLGNTDCYILFVPSLIFRDIRENSTFTQANREARERNENNPLFNSADLLWDNILIYEIEDIPVITTTQSGHSVQVAPTYLCGAQALAQVWAMRPQTVEDTFDYKRKVGIAIKEWMKIEKLRFGSGTSDTDDLKDHGVLTGYFAAVAD